MQRTECNQKRRFTLHRLLALTLILFDTTNKFTYPWWITSVCRGEGEKGFTARNLSGAVISHKKEYKTWAASAISAWLAVARVSKYLHSYSQVTRFSEGAHCACAMCPGTGTGTVPGTGLIHQSLGLFAQATRRARERESCKFYNIISDNFTHISHTHIRTHSRTHFNTVAKVLCMCFMIPNIDLFFTPSPPLPSLAKGSF